MYILIEYSGTASQNKVVNNITRYLEHNYGITCDHVIGKEDSNIVLYTEDFKRIVEFKAAPTEQMLDFYIADLVEKD